MVPVRGHYPVCRFDFLEDIKQGFLIASAQVDWRMNLGRLKEVGNLLLKVYKGLAIYDFHIPASLPQVSRSGCAFLNSVLALPKGNFLYSWYKA